MDFGGRSQIGAGMQVDYAAGIDTTEDEIYLGVLQGVTKDKRYRL